MQTGRKGRLVNMLLDQRNVLFNRVRRRGSMGGWHRQNEMRCIQAPYFL